MKIPFQSILEPARGLSVGSDIFSQYRKQELSPNDYMVFSAAQTAALCHEERMLVYIPMSSQIRQYIERRFSGGEMDPSWSKKMGDWQDEIFRAFDHNQSIMNHFLWARDKCSKVGLLNEVEKLNRMHDKFQSLQFPHEGYQHACQVMKMDQQTRTYRKTII